METWMFDWRLAAVWKIAILDAGRLRLDRRGAGLITVG